MIVTGSATLTVALESEQERAVVAMVVKYLREYRRERRNGQLGFKISHKDGGVIGKHVQMEFPEK